MRNLLKKKKAHYPVDSNEKIRSKFSLKPYHRLISDKPFRFLFSAVYNGGMMNSVYVLGDKVYVTYGGMLGDYTEASLSDYTRETLYMKWVRNIYGDPFLKNEDMI